MPDPAPRPQLHERVGLTDDDFDALGHLNQARYHGLLGGARGRLLRLPWGGERILYGTFVVARSELDHHREVPPTDGFVDVSARVERVGTKSITIANELTRLDGTLAASGVCTMVAWDPEARRSRAITDVERAAYGG